MRDLRIGSGDNREGGEHGKGSTQSGVSRYRGLRKQQQIFLKAIQDNTIQNRRAIACFLFARIASARQQKNRVFKN
jgi:hypothetical protein